MKDTRDIAFWLFWLILSACVLWGFWQREEIRELQRISAELQAQRTLMQQIVVYQNKK